MNGKYGSDTRRGYTLVTQLDSSAIAQALATGGVLSNIIETNKSLGKDKDMVTGLAGNRNQDCVGEGQQLFTRPTDRLKSKWGRVLRYTKFHWLSQDQMLNVCMTWSHKMKYFWKSIPILALTAGCDVTPHMNAVNVSLQGVKRLLNGCVTKWQRSTRSLECGNCSCAQAIWHGSQHWERKGPLMLRNTWKKITFFN
jgi:hypothetical protein